MPPDDQHVVFLDRDVAEELLDLVADAPGQADEDLLDEAAAALRQTNGALPSEAQQAVARGEAVALGLESDEVETLSTLIADNTEADQGALRSVSRSLKSKLRAARKKASRS